MERGLTQRDLRAVGVSYAYISRIEAGDRTPSVKAIRLLAEKLGVTPEYLESGEDPPNLLRIRGEIERALTNLEDGHPAAPCLLRAMEEFKNPDGTLRYIPQTGSFFQVRDEVE